MAGEPAGRVATLARTAHVVYDRTLVHVNTGTVFRVLRLKKTLGNR